MLYIMRHGKTDWNTKHVLQGRTDVLLNEEGREMAIKAHDDYIDVDIDVCYCSPLKRAYETAKLFIGDRNIPIITDERLVEMCFGEYEGSSYTDNQVSIIFDEPENYVESIGGTETFAELFKRTGDFLKEIIEPELKENKNVLIVGHGAMNASIICQLKNLPIKDFWSSGLDQCKLMKLKD